MATGALEWSAADADDALDIPVTYRAPEETGRLARWPDYRSDFYRLGVIWYELLTGQPPFPGTDAVKVIWQHLAEQPVSPAERNPELAAAVAAVILKLLAKDPEERYQSAEGLRHDWNRAIQWQKEARPKETFSLGESDFPQRFTAPNRLIGRTDDFRQALELVEFAALEPVRACLVVKGKAQVGKSFFMQEVGKVLARKDFVLVRSTCRDEDKTPFFALKTAFDRLARTMLAGSDDEIGSLRTDLSDVLGETAAVLTDFSPAWEDLVGPVQPVPGLNAQETQNRLAFVLANALGEIAQPGRPVIFLLEDLHFAAPQTLRLLSALLNESQLRHFILAVTVRSDVQVSPELSTWLNQFQKDQHPKDCIITLNPSGLPELEVFLLEASIAPGQVAGLAATLVRKTGGIPFFVHQLLDTAAGKGFITPDRKKRIWQVDLQAVSELGITDNMLEFLRAKVLRLPPDTLRFLQAAAVQGLHFDLPILKAALQPDENEESVANTARILNRLEIILPSATPGSYRFSNNELLTLLEELTPEHDKQTYNAKVAHHLYQEGIYQHNDPVLFDLLSYVVEMQAPIPEQYLPLLEEGGRKAEAQGAFDASLRYYTLIRDSGPASFNAELRVLQMMVFGLRFGEYAEAKAQLLARTKPDILQQAEMDNLEARSTRSSGSCK